MNKNPLVSIIIPAYNVEQFIARAIKSAVDQNYSNIEILIINDGSTDSTLKIASAISTEHNNATVYDKINGGLSDARNFGISKAKGEYLAFLDGDDYIHPEMISTLINSCLNHVADIAICGITRVQKENSISYISSLKKERVYQSSDAVLSYLSSNDFNESACNKLFKKELFDNIRFPLGRKHEDAYIMHLLLSKSNRVVHVGAPLYYYVRRMNSITSKSFSLSDFELIRCYRQRFNYYKDNILYREYAWISLYKSYIYIYDKLIYYKAQEKYERCFNLCRKRLLQGIFHLMLSRKTSLKYILKSIMICFMPSIYKFSIRNTI